LTTPDEQVLERARTYDAQALAEIYDRYAVPIYRYLFRLLGEAEQAEDLAGEVFLKLLQSLAANRGPRDRIDGWLFRVAHNLAMDQFRQHKKAPEVPLDVELAAGGGQPPEVVEQRLAGQQLRACLRHLTSEQQQVVLLRFAEERPLAEVARLMGKSEGAVKTQQHRAVSRLRKLLGDWGG
jgi:RNA polymerase sigma-70 factor (ECF subfamily)